jgi:hypothetical protein
MDDLLDVQLKQEIEKISEDVKGIMKRVNELYPSPAGAPSPKEPDNPAIHENRRSDQ